jgi:uncharacterized membrane protein
MRVLRGLFLAFAFFAASFALHIVGGATDQGWLFAIAVVLIYLTATGFPMVALFAAGRPISEGERTITLSVGAIAGVAFTTGAYWAANGRSFAWWEIPAAVVSVAVVSALLWLASTRWSGLQFGTGAPATRPGR